MSKKKTIKYDNLILEVLKNNPKKGFNFRQLKAIIKEKNEKLIKRSLQNLSYNSYILEVSPGKFLLNKSNYVEGEIDKTKKGSAYLISKEHDKDFYIKQENIKNALNGDLVSCLIINSKEVKVVDVIKRNKKQYVGSVFFQNNNQFVEYNSNKDNIIFNIKNKTLNENDIIVFKIKDWTGSTPYAEMVKNLGQKGEVNNEIHAILEEFELPYVFEEKHIKEAKELKLLQNKTEDKKRKDLTKITTFTIDPDNAKDFDDAISFKQIKKNVFEIGIHIADVSHFLKENTQLDLEAQKRATSVYLVDRVVPMLPETISNNLCSLNPKENKYAFSVLFVFDNRKLIKEWFGKTIINSNERFSYNEAQYIIENKSNIIPKEISLNKKEKNISLETIKAIIKINEIAETLREKRHQQGSISFNKTEVGFVLDKNKNPIKTKIKKQLQANKLIEEYMLLANKKVAELFTKEKKGIFRIHDYPDDEKIITLERITKKLGYKTQLRDSKNLNTQLNLLLKQTQGSPEKNLIDTLVIRSMSKAKYSTKNIGHFGLNFEKYTHFTSPIRRYPDVIVHRELEEILNKKKTKKDLEKKCLHSSKREEIATKAERASIKFMQVKYMSTKIGRVFNGTISGINDRGLFVESEESKAEGFIQIKNVPGDYFIYNEKEMLLIGRHTKEEYRLGDSIKIKVDGVNEIKNQINYTLLEKT